MAAAEFDQTGAHRLILRQNEVFFAYGPLFGRKTMHIFCQWDEISAFFASVFPSNCAIFDTQSSQMRQLRKKMREENELLP